MIQLITETPYYIDIYVIIAQGRLAAMYKFLDNCGHNYCYKSKSRSKSWHYRIYFDTEEEMLVFKIKFGVELEQWKLPCT